MDKLRFVAAGALAGIVCSFIDGHLFGPAFHGAAVGMAAMIIANALPSPPPQDKTP